MICQDHQADDRRIRYYRNTANLGAIKNFNRAFELACGTYFMWAGDHDLWDQSYVTKCISILEDDPTAVLAYSRTMLVDIEGNPIGLMPDQIDTRGITSPSERYLNLIRNLRWGNMVYGVIRSEALKQTGLLKNVFGPDHLLLAELSLKGTFAQISEPLFFRRRNRPTEDVDRDAEAWKLQAIKTLDPGDSHNWREATLSDLYRSLRNEHLRLIRSCSSSRREKLKMVLETLKWYDSDFGVGWPGGPLLQRLCTNRFSDSLLTRIGVS